TRSTLLNLFLLSNLPYAVYSKETAAEQSSSFMIGLEVKAYSRFLTLSLDVTQVSTMLRHFTKRSLLLLDEFGKGTNVEDGVSLLSTFVKQQQNQCLTAIASAATIKYLQNQPDNSRTKVLV